MNNKNEESWNGTWGNVQKERGWRQPLEKKKENAGAPDTDNEKVQRQNMAELIKLVAFGLELQS